MKLLYKIYNPLIFKYENKMSFNPLGQGFTHGQDIHYDVVLS